MSAPRSRLAASTAILVVPLSALLALAGGPPAPGLPSLLGRIEVLTGWPLLGLAWASAVGTIIAWVAQSTLRTHGSDRGTIERWTILSAIVVPAMVPGAGVIGLLPALWLASRQALNSGKDLDRRIALLLWAAVVTVLADARIAPAGAVAIIAAMGNLLHGLAFAPANDDTMPSLAWRVGRSGYLQGSCPQFISE